MEHPAIFVDCKCSDEGEMHILAISEIGICYFWSGNNVDDLRNKKPTKIALSDSFLSRTRQAFSIFAAKLQGIDGPNSVHVLLAYGSVVKPSFDKVLVCYGTDINLGISDDGALLPNIQTTIPKKGQSVKKQETVTALDRANAEDAILPLPKLHAQEKKRKHGVTKPSGDVEPVVHSDLTTTRSIQKRVPVQRIEDDSICIEDMMRDCGVIDTVVDQSMEGHPGIPINILSDVFGSGSIKVDANLPSKKIRAHLRSLKPGDACKLLDKLISAWRTRSGSTELVLRWIYCLLVVHGRFIQSEKSTKVISNLEKMCAERYTATEDLLKLSGRLRLIMAQVGKGANNLSELPSEEMQDAAAIQSDEEDDEQINETVFGQDSDASQTSDDDAE
uniref:Small-subunit processome Utp12 domain-containing protein n=1 Tax=Arundo donax TaxID=35708 RepID=A0A0A9CGK0_ARUDO